MNTGMKRSHSRSRCSLIRTKGIVGRDRLHPLSFKKFLYTLGVAISIWCFLWNLLPILQKVYLTKIRPILEYGVQGWQDIPEFLSNKLESIQKRALHIIYPCHSYLELRTQLCCKYIQKMTQNDHPINFLKPRTAISGHSYNLWASDNNRNIVYADRSCCSLWNMWICK